MKVIAVASQKGGSGKTTLAGHLAVQAEMSGAGPVALVDTDPQGSLSEWWNEREAENPLFARTTIDKLKDDVARMSQMGIELLIIDTPPAITQTIATVLTVADLLIIPTRPSPHDLRAVGATVELAEGLDTPLIFVVNGATPRARITGEAAIALSQHGTLAPSIIHQRVDFASSMIDGRTVMELNPASKSSEELTKLWSYISGRLEKKRPALSSEISRMPTKPDTFQSGNAFA
ncbi:ParA family protein [Sneathiella glossodoripedis]|uniref:ParA family protein n=1 Tax=Sneathiella glossodoripedis TaxID=418853 RepID=UPI00047251BF|nr:ParA family protein [Sneathiella glossodoripedis]